MKLKILVTMPKGHVRDSFFPDIVVKELESIAYVEWNDTDTQLRGEELKRRITDVDVCMTGWGSSRYDKDLLETAERLRVVAHTGGSVAGIVSDYLYDRGITVVSGNQLYAESVAEGTIAYILTALRMIPYYSGEMQKGIWAKTGVYYNEGLLDQKIGLVGFGAVAKFLVPMLEPFRTEIKVYDPYVSDEVLLSYGVKRASLEEIFTTSKIISIHAAKTPDTYHLIGRELLQAIPDNALLVNTARASIVDTAALEGELAKNRFKAVLDVYDVEPLPADSKLLNLPNVILMPHMAGPTVDRRKLVTLALIEDIQRIYEGKEPKLAINRKYAMAMTQ
jgi:phosphoglycerate dehydrogenase-like enzyme